MKRLVIGNWKLNPKTLKGAVALARAVDKKGAIICPPHLFLEEVSHVLKKAAACAQDVSFEKRSFTGGISVAQLKSLGVKHALVGHSSRRAEGESDKDISKKLKMALEGSLTAILCIGESLQVHKRGEGAVERFVEGQIKKNLSRIKSSKKLIVAYEPVWAVGTKKSDTPEESALTISYIKMVLKKIGWGNVPVLYGGSVNSKNVKDFLGEKVIDGFLVGLSSLDAKEFNKIIKING